MKQVEKSIGNKLQEIVGLQKEIKLQEDRYTALIKADEPFENARELYLRIKYLKVELKAKQDHAITLLQSFEA